METSELLSRICVRPPYFALEHLTEVAPGAVAATIPVEQRCDFELAAISGAEAGRHLAILGSCAAATLPELGSRHYYLAQRATLRGHPAEVDPSAKRLKGWAQARLEDRRSVRAEATLVSLRGEPLYDLEVQYSVLPERVFERVFAAQRRDLRRSPRELGAAMGAVFRHNPYRDLPALRVVSRSTEVFCAELPEVQPEQCNGHFARFPALPVAVVMGALGWTCGELLRTRSSDPALRGWIVSSDVVAERLVFAGSRVLFQARFVDGDEHLAQCEGVARAGDGSTIGRLRVAYGLCVAEAGRTAVMSNAC
jgi:hypothetical protein